MSICDKLDIFIVANPHRKSLAKESMDALSIPYHINMTPDYVVSKKWQPAKKWNYIFKKNAKAKNGHMRCQFGHRDCLKKRDTNKVQLMLEDDAVPNRKDWLELVEKGMGLLDEFQIVSMHGRNRRPKDWIPFDHQGTRFLKPKRGLNGDVWCLGSLAFLIREDAIQNFVKLPYTGMPMDMIIANKYSFCVISDSPFNHDRREGSLIDKRKKHGKDSSKLSW